MTSFPAASPSRATLQSVHDFLLTPNPEQVDRPKIPFSESSNSIPNSTVRLFDSLAGEWQFDRKITNFHRDGFAGIVLGTAVFQPRMSKSPDILSEYLYLEKGSFKTTSGLEMRVSRRWIWQLSHRKTPSTSETQSCIISIYFVKADGETEDYLYNELGFEEREDGRMAAYAEHPCGEDFYKSTYEMGTDEKEGQKLVSFDVVHEVKGPSKDYVSRTRYSI
jgi:tRNA A64-2'-O-ribosylphosphate transferase